MCVCTQSCPTLYDHMDCSQPGFSVHRILQARILEWVAISYARGIFLIQGSNPSCVSCTAGEFFTTETLGKSIKLTRSVKSGHCS